MTNSTGAPGGGTGQPTAPDRWHPVDQAGLADRLRLTADEVGRALLFVPALPLLIITVVGWSLSLIGVGLLLVNLAVPPTGRLAGHSRRVSGRLLGEPIVVDYRPTGAAGPVGRAWIWGRDEQRWRDVEFLLFAVTGGFGLSLAVGGLLVAPLADVVLAIVTGQLFWWALAVVFLPLWWLFARDLATVRARVELAIFHGSRAERLERRVAAVSASRTETLDHSAAELRRIERDLHDGAQARIVSLGMNIGLAEELIRADPGAAADLLTEARQAATSVLEELRTLVRGIHPPVLADRGLAGAVEALALQLAVPVTIDADLPAGLPAPLENAVYFAIAECLANVVKHSAATRAWVTLSHREGLLRAEIGDDGKGGILPGAAGSGLAGLASRLQAFDGTMTLSSPVGGPTVVSLEVPCGSSSQKT